MTPIPADDRSLAEVEKDDPFQPHDPGCRCWPHVSQRAAIEAATQAATAEYREGLRRPIPADDPLREAAEAVVTFYEERKRGDEQREWWNVIDPLRAALRADSHDGEGLREAVEAYAREHPRWLSDEGDGCPESLALRRALSKEQGRSPEGEG